jgi:hypothetical protein
MSNAIDCRFTIQLDEVVSTELKSEAAEFGLELHDHMSGILTAHVLPRLKSLLPDLAERLDATARVKAAASRISRQIARDHGIQHDHTLRVFQAIRRDPDLTSEYLRATGCETGFEAGNPLKHKLNLALGAISKNAAGAKVKRVLRNGREEADMIRNIRGEFCGSVTKLEPGDDTSANPAQPRPRIGADASSAPGPSGQADGLSRTMMTDGGEDDMRTFKPWREVRNCSYFQQVLAGMMAFDAKADSDSSVIVRFGLTGRGVRPNYQIESPASVVAVRGDTHERHQHTRFDDRELSQERFTYAQVQALHKRCIDIQDGRLDPRHEA